MQKGPQPPAAEGLLALNVASHLQNKNGAGMPNTITAKPKVLLP
jgi:hypothetical protein